VLGVGYEEFVDLFLMFNSNAEEILSKAPDLGLRLVARLPECGANLVRSLLANVSLKQHLHGNFARFTTP
jgi:hypothetical protein